MHGGQIAEENVEILKTNAPLQPQSALSLNVMSEPLIRAPAREDASHAPPQAARPLPLRAWPIQRGPNSNDNFAPAFGACEIDWLSFAREIEGTPQPQAEPARSPSPQRKRSVALRPAACAAAGIAGLLIAAVALVVH